MVAHATSREHGAPLSRAASSSFPRTRESSILFTAIDADTDGAAAETCLDMTGNSSYAGGLASPPSDVSFYYYTNAFGRVAAYARKHSSEVVYEYLVHHVFGEVVYLGVLDNGTSPGTASDKMEDTITTLGDNNAEMLTAQSSHAPARRVSLVGATIIARAGAFSDGVSGLFTYGNGYAESALVWRNGL